MSTMARPAAEYAPPIRRRSWLALVVRGDSLLRTGHLLTVSALLTSALGAGYWALATRLYGTEWVGRSYAAVSAMIFLSGIGQLSLSDTLLRFVPVSGTHTRRLVLRTYGAVCVVTLVLAIGFVLLQPLLVPGLAFLHTPGLGLVFVLSAVVYSLFTLQDAALTGLRKPGLVILENASFSTVKIAFCVLLVATDAGILLSWTVALAVAVAGTNLYLFTCAIPRRRRAVERAPTAPVQSPTLGFMAAGYLAGMCATAMMTLSPLLVLDRLGPSQNAYYSVAWVSALMLYLFNRNMGTSLLIEGARDARRLREHLRHMLRHAVPLLTGFVVVGVAAAPLLLRVFGRQYAQNCTGVFRLLVLSALPDLVVATAIGVSYARRRIRVVVAVNGALVTLIFGLAVVLMPVMGLAGIGTAWLAAQTTVAIALLVLRSAWLPKDSDAAPANPARAAQAATTTGGGP